MSSSPASSRSADSSDVDTKPQVDALVTTTTTTPTKKKASQNKATTPRKRKTAVKKKPGSDDHGEHSDMKMDLNVDEPSPVKRSKATTTGSPTGKLTEDKLDLIVMEVFNAGLANFDKKAWCIENDVNFTAIHHALQNGRKGNVRDKLSRFSKLKLAGA